MSDLSCKTIQSKKLAQFLGERSIQIGYYGDRSLDLSRVAAVFVDLETQGDGAFFDRYPRISEDLEINVFDRDPSGSGQYDSSLKSAPTCYEA